MRINRSVVSARVSRWSVDHACDPGIEIALQRLGYSICNLKRARSKIRCCNGVSNPVLERDHPPIIQHHDIIDDMTARDNIGERCCKRVSSARGLRQLRRALLQKIAAERSDHAINQLLIRWVSRPQVGKSRVQPHRALLVQKHLPCSISLNEQARHVRKSTVQFVSVSELHDRPMSAHRPAA